MKTFYIILWIVFLISFFLMWLFMQRARHKERVMMIERGLDPDASQSSSGNNSLWIKIARIVIGLSVGLLIIAILISLNLLERFGNGLPLAILGICGGLAMLWGNHSGKGRD